MNSSPAIAPATAIAAQLTAPLTPMPERMQGLPVDDRGYPLPWAVTAQKWHEAVVHDLCRFCGQKLAKSLVFVLDPAEGLTRTASELPCHHECAEWAAVNEPAGIALLWTTKRYDVVRDKQCRPVFRLGDPDKIEYFAEGRKSTHAEIARLLPPGTLLLTGSVM